MIPEECKMPDLSPLTEIKLQSKSIMYSLIGNPGISHKEGRYRNNFARLVDKAVYEYQLSREAILSQIEERNRSSEEMSREGTPLFILSYIDHFENCINSITRVLNLLNRVKKSSLSFSIPRNLKRSMKAYSRDLRDFRNIIEHIDEEIQKDKILKDQPVMLSISKDGEQAIIGNLQIRFNDVAMTLRKLHKIGILLFEANKD